MRIGGGEVKETRAAATCGWSLVLPLPLNELSRPVATAVVVAFLVVSFPDIDFFRGLAVIPAVFVINRGRCRIYPGRGPVLPVTGHVHFLVPDIVNKVHRPTAGVIPVAVAAPRLHVPRGNAHIHRRMPDPGRPDDDGLFMNQPGRGKAADIDPAVKIGFRDTD